MFVARWRLACLGLAAPGWSRSRYVLAFVAQLPTQLSGSGIRFTVGESGGSGVSKAFSVNERPVIDGSTFTDLHRQHRQPAQRPRARSATMAARKPHRGAATGQLDAGGGVTSADGDTPHGHSEVTIECGSSPADGGGELVVALSALALLRQCARPRRKTR